MAISVEFGPGMRFVAPEQIEERLARHPAPPAHHLLLHHRDVRRRPAERGQSEPQEEAGQVPQGLQFRVMHFRTSVTKVSNLAMSGPALQMSSPGLPLARGKWTNWRRAG